MLNSKSEVTHINMKQHENTAAALIVLMVMKLLNLNLLHKQTSKNLFEEKICDIKI